MDFGHFLAGLIDGDGHFSVQQQLVICFHSSDAPLAYYVKSQLGFGNVRRVSGKNACIFVVTCQRGVEKVIRLVAGKLRTEHRYEQAKRNILSHTRFALLRGDVVFDLNTSRTLDDYWFSGFAGAAASFQIKTLLRMALTSRAKGAHPSRLRREIRLNFQVDQKTSPILAVIQEYFGGYVGYRRSQNTYYYGSTSFGVARRIVAYFDRFRLLSSKHTDYLKWRKAYLLVQRGEHLSCSG